MAMKTKRRRPHSLTAQKFNLPLGALAPRGNRSHAPANSRSRQTALVLRRTSNQQQRLAGTRRQLKPTRRRHPQAAPVNDHARHRRRAQRQLRRPQALVVVRRIHEERTAQQSRAFQHRGIRPDAPAHPHRQPPALPQRPADQHAGRNGMICREAPALPACGRHEDFMNGAGPGRRLPILREALVGAILEAHHERRPHLGRGGCEGVIELDRQGSHANVWYLFGTTRRGFVSTSFRLKKRADASRVAAGAYPSPASIGI